jgi:hypothetical protein
MGLAEHEETRMLLEGKTQYQVGLFFMEDWHLRFPGQPDMSGFKLRCRALRRGMVTLYIEEYRDITCNRALDLVRKVAEFIKLSGSKGIQQRRREPGFEPW